MREKKNTNKRTTHNKILDFDEIEFGATKCQPIERVKFSTFHQIVIGIVSLIWHFSHAISKINMQRVPFTILSFYFSLTSTHK